MRFLTSAITAFIAFAFTPVISVAADDATVFAPKMRALLVSLESYSGQPLKYVDADLKSLQNALDSFGCETKIIRDVTLENRKSYKEEFENEVSDWCARLRSDETAVLYLAGHGVQDPETGKLYIPMLDFLDAPQERRYRDAAVSYAWVRERFEAADCKNRVVFIDACHSGAVSRTFDAAVSRSPVGEFIAPLSRNGGAPQVTVFASSSAEQESWLWDAQKSSLFTYWLVKGLSGYADADADFSITLAELNNYVVERVEEVSLSPVYRMKRQTPTLYNESANASFAFPRPARKTFEATKYCADFLELRLRKLRSELGGDSVRVAFPSAFSSDSFGPQGGATNYGTFPQALASNLLTELTLDADDGFCEIVETSENLDDSDALAKLVEAESLDAVVSGRVSLASPTTLALRINLTTVKKKDASGGVSKSSTVVSEKIWLTKEDRALLGDAFSVPAPKPNADVEPRYVVGPLGAVSLAESQESEEIVAQLRDELNPIDDAKSPFNVQIYVKNRLGQYEPRPGRTVDGKHYVPLDVGEEYWIRLTNRYADADGCYVRLFVDGLNTLSELRPVVARSMEPQAAPVATMKMETAPRVLDPQKARPWLIDQGRDVDIKGFAATSENGDGQGTWGAFKVSQYPLAMKKDVDESEIGVVTAIFSVPKRTLALSTDKPSYARKNGVDHGEIRALVSPEDADYSYRWERKKASDASWTPIPNATSNVYRLTADDVGAYLRVVVRGSDAKLGEIVAETKAAVEQSRSRIGTDINETTTARFRETTLLEEQAHTTFQIYYLSNEDFQRLIEKN